MYSSSILPEISSSLLRMMWFLSYIDAHYRTIPKRFEPWSGGHSMGGYESATRIGMKHDDVFGSLYIMSHAAYPRGRPDGESGNGKVLLAVKTPEDAAKLPFFARASSRLRQLGHQSEHPPLYLDLPTKAGESQPEVLARWAANASAGFY